MVPSERGEESLGEELVLLMGLEMWLGLGVGERWPEAPRQGLRSKEDEKMLGVMSVTDSVRAGLGEQ